MLKKLASVIAAIVIIAWGLILFANGQPKIISWWFVMFFGFAGVLLVVLSLALILKEGVKKRRPGTSLLALLIISLVAAWPAGWFFHIGHIAYPAGKDRVQPAVHIRLPVNQPVIVAWGGDSVEENYHVTVPFERWAYDLLAHPAALKSPDLEDYGIFGQTVIAPVDGTIVDVRDDMPDLPAGTELDDPNIHEMLGNYVFIQIEETETYLVIAHLMSDSVTVQPGQFVIEGTPIARVGNSGSTSEPHIHIHHQRQNPARSNFMLAEGLPLFFRDIDGPPMPTGGVAMVDGREVPVGMTISPLEAN